MDNREVQHLRKELSIQLAMSLNEMTVEEATKHLNYAKVLSDIYLQQLQITELEARHDLKPY